MKLFAFGGVVLAALFTAPANSQTTATAASLKSPTTHVRRSFFRSNQNRSDVAAHMESMFRKLDLNHDGFVTRAEVATAQTQFDERTTKNAPKRAAKMFDRLDANHDGQITQAEANAARAAKSAGGAKSPKPKRRPASSWLFARADANKDGMVTRAEFDSAVASGKIRVRHAGMRGSAMVRLFDIADLDKDGRVSLGEAQRAALQQFDAADLNRDGVLTPDELRQASKAARAKPAA